MRRTSPDLTDLTEAMMNRTHRSAPKSKPRANGRRMLVLAFALAFVGSATPRTAHAAADDVASLYGPRPPADATYLRVVNLSAQTAKLALPGAVRLLELAPGAATGLDVVRPGTPLRITVDAVEPVRLGGGATVASADTAGKTITVAVERGEAPGWRAVPIALPATNADSLRAQLNLYSFAQGCDGTVALEASHTSAVFEHVATGQAVTRSINPVAATLVAICGSAVSAPFALPRLAAGRSYSLFLSGSAKQPVLRGAPDELDWPGRAQ